MNNTTISQGFLSVAARALGGSAVVEADALLARLLALNLERTAQDGAAKVAGVKPTR